IAGSTGSIKSSQQLIKAIKNYEFGSVFLYGLYNFLNQSSTFNITEIHPQFYLSKLLEFLAEDIRIIQQYRQPQFQISTDSRIDFFNQIYHSESKKINKIEEILKNDLQNNIEIYEASNQVMEAKFIAKFCQENSNNSNKKIGIIINNQNLQIILKSFLNKYKILFNDTTSQESLNLDLLNFIQLIFINKFNEFNSHNFLSFLKNPLFIKNSDENFINNFEIDILRQERSDLGLEGLFTKIKNTKYQKFIEDIFDNLPQSKNLQSLINSLEYFTKKSFNNLLNQSRAGNEIADFFRSLKKISGDDFNFESLNDLKILFNEISYFEKNDRNAKIEILTPIEARNLSFDIVIVTSLNQDDFPSSPSNDWIGSKIKKELEIYKNLQKIGQNNFDFCNYLSNPKIILTYCQSLMGKELVESVFLTKLATYLLKNQISINKTNYFNNRFFSIDKTRKYFLNYPAPTLEKTYIPNKFSATDIGDLIQNPYAIYIKKILKLEPLKIIDYQASSSEFGSFVHKALEHYIKNNNSDNFLDIFNEFFTSKFAKIIWFSKFTKIFADFLIENFEFNDFKNITEMPISFYINEIKISGKIDRIIINNNEVAIIDYKTGEPPSKSSVLNGLSPQLIIYALGFSKNLNPLQNLSELIYWKLKINNQKTIKILDKNEDIA
ncbi:MAG: PD-(D/E)XK nuclease family protein, partial [Alphaproteobacteria bacterium]